MTGDNRNLDKYDPYADFFESFTDILPESSGYSTLACVEHSLFVFQNVNCWEIDLATLQIKQAVAIPQGKWWSHFPACVYDQEIYFSRYDDSCIIIQSNKK